MGHSPEEEVPALPFDDRTGDRTGAKGSHLVLNSTSVANCAPASLRLNKLRAGRKQVRFGGHR